MSDEKNVMKRSDSTVAAPGNANIQDAGSLIRATIDELERMLDAKQVVGEPMHFEGATVVPLVSLGFGFGAGAGGGGGANSDGNKGEGGGSGGGGGGGVKPVGVVIVQNGRVTLEPIPEPASGVAKLGSAIADALDRRADKSKDDD